MCFYKENSLLAKRNVAKLAQGEKPSSPEASLPEKKEEEEEIVEEVLLKKKKLLDQAAPGLFDHLLRIGQDEPSTENTSELDTDLESDDFKQSILISNPARTLPFQRDCDLSNIIKIRPPLNNTIVFQIPPLECLKIQNETKKNNIFEEMQVKKILSLLNENNIVLNSIISSQDKTQKNLHSCIEELKSFKNELLEGNKSQLEKIEQLKEQKKKSAHFDSNPTPANLYNHFFGTGHVYRYELVLANEIPAPIFRERNLVLNIQLVDIITREIVNNPNKIVVQLSLHTWEVPSSPILRNKTGNKAVMGETEVELVEGEASFDRIQINEVTSKFIHGYVAMLIVPTKPSNIGTSLADHDIDDNYIDFEHIKPLMLEKVIVKSKKKNPKKKDDN